MNALTLLVDAANAESKSLAANAEASATEETKNRKKETGSTCAIDSENKASTDASAHSISPGSATHTSSLPGGAVVLPGGAKTVAAALAARENAVYQQIQQQQGAAAKIRYVEEIRQEEEQFSKDRLATIMLQHEREEQQQAAKQQATIMRLVGRGSPSAVTKAPIGATSPQGPQGMNQCQEAEYLQQLRLEALAQHQRQENLAKLVISNEMGSANGNIPGSPPSKTVSKDLASHKYQRQDTALQKAILIARADEELRKQQLVRQQKVQEQREIKQQRDQEHHRQQLQQTAVLQLIANGESNSSFANALRAATPSAGPQYPGSRSSDDSAILHLLEERERQRLMLQHQPKIQQSQLRPFLPQSVASSAAIPSALQHHLQAQQRSHGGNQGERANLIRAAVAAATNDYNNPHQPSMPSRVLSAFAAAEEQEKQELLQLQRYHQNGQKAFQSSGMMMDVMAKSQQQQQQQKRLHQQALVHHQQQAEALAQQQQESIQINREMQHSQESVERDPSFHNSKSTILPCRARGMPMDHNMKTAYFVIPENIKHGTELLCSYFACRNAGIKFRYCVYCKLPVAKRNFAKRHRHSGKIPENALSKDTVVDNITPGDGPKNMCILASPHPTQEKLKAQLEEPNPEEPDPTSKEKLSRSVSSMKTSTISSVETNEVKKDPCEKLASPIRDDNSRTFKSSAANCEEKPTLDAESSKPTHDSDDMARVPEPTDSIDVNQLSSSKDSSPVCTSPKPMISSCDRRKAWEQLLLQRPKTKRPNSDAMLAWIRDVLRVSDFKTGVNIDGSGGNDGEVQTKSSPLLCGAKGGKIDETRPSSAKKSKTKALLSRKELEDMEHKMGCDDNNDKNSNTENAKLQRVEEDIPNENIAEKASEKRDYFPDDVSTSSEESVDLRARKKLRK